MMPIYQLKTIYKLYPEEIVNIVLRSILKTGNKYIYKLDIPKDTPVRTLLDENPYPERDGDYLVKILNEEYNAEVLFPYVELSIPKESVYAKKVLSQAELEELFAKKFTNLESYIKILAPNITQEKKEIEEKLRKLPPLIKKIVKINDKMGLLMFKSMQIEIEKTESNNSSKGQGRRNRTKNIKLDVSVFDLAKIYKHESDLSDLLMSSLNYEDGAGFSLELDAIKDKFMKKPRFFSPQTDVLKLKIPKLSSDVIVRLPVIEFYIPELNMHKALVLQRPQILSLCRRAFANLKDYSEEFKNLKLEAEKKTRILLYTYNTKEERILNLIQYFEKSAPEANCKVRTVSLSSDDYLHIENETQKTEETSVMKIRRFDPPLKPILQKELDNMKWAQYIMLTYHHISSSIIKFNGIMRQIKSSPNAVRALEGKKIIFFIFVDETIEAVERYKLKKSLLELHTYFGKNLRIFNFKLAKSLILSTDSTQAEINAKILKRKLEHLDEPFDDITLPQMDGSAKFLSYEVKIEKSSKNKIVSKVIGETPLDPKKIKDGRIVSHYRDHKIYCTVTLLSLTITLYRYLDQEGNKKIEHVYVIGFRPLLELLVVGEYQGLQRYLVENVQILKVTDPRKKDIVYRLGYLNQDADGNYENLKVRDIHLNNGFLLDFNYEMKFNKERFLLKFEYPRIELYDPSDSTKRTIKINEQMFQQMIDSSFNVNITLSEKS